MKKAKKEELLKLIEQEMGKADLSLEKTTQDVRDFSKYSWSQSGDRYHSESAAELAREYFNNLIKLRDEVKNTSDEQAESALPASYIEIGYNDGEKVKFYLVQSSALLPGILLITVNSPIGKAINGKKEGDGFSYSIKKGEKTVSFSGKIEKIE